MTPQRQKCRLRRRDESVFFRSSSKRWTKCASAKAIGCLAGVTPHNPLDEIDRRKEYGKQYMCPALAESFQQLNLPNYEKDDIDDWNE
jgi:hypothetical protein